MVAFRHFSRGGAVVASGNLVVGRAVVASRQQNNCRALVQEVHKTRRQLIAFPPGLGVQHVGNARSHPFQCLRARTVVPAQSSQRVCLDAHETHIFPFLARMDRSVKVVATRTSTVLPSRNHLAHVVHDSGHEGHRHLWVELTVLPAGRFK